MIEPFVSGTEATCGVLERSDGAILSLPPIEIIPGEGAFDYTAKYLLKSTQEICPGRFSPEISAAILDQSTSCRSEVGIPAALALATFCASSS